MKPIYSNHAITEIAFMVVTENKIDDFTGFLSSIEKQYQSKEIKSKRFGKEGSDGEVLVCDFGFATLVIKENSSIGGEGHEVYYVELPRVQYNFDVIKSNFFTHLNAVFGRRDVYIDHVVLTFADKFIIEESDQNESIENFFKSGNRFFPPVLFESGFQYFEIANGYMSLIKGDVYAHHYSLNTKQIKQGPIDGELSLSHSTGRLKLSAIKSRKYSEKQINDYLVEFKKQNISFLKEVFSKDILTKIKIYE